MPPSCQEINGKKRVENHPPVIFLTKPARPVNILMISDGFSRPQGPPQFLLPLAVSLAFGLMFDGFILLFQLPVLIRIVHDFCRRLGMVK